ncbi:diguanylate cyclase [Hydrogenovibrio sp. 3SP14C1]|uniref:sensor domain-containing diguanylate cyclase n=1 Tax=Hydrogenovibrio sp. 3SP14C1 TaxID=3038774 RepID=UPI002417A0D7|nr:diguanylate cyclase [Hydrogenovibrio sp. 3SP14C1]MDG4813442.1 diguanylate cyclase [Hydrogenovibrio sp. 3SP14C1]
MPTSFKHNRFIKWRSFSSKRLAFLVAISVFIFLSSLSFWVSFSNYDTQKQHLINYSSHYEINSFSASKKALNIHAKTIFQTSIYKDDIFQLMAKAYHGNSQVKDEVRAELYRKLHPIYQLLQLEHIRQLHFHLPGGISFLRFHRPAKYGDNISSVRYSITQVNKTKAPISGFEEGRIFNGFRHVFPIIYKDELVGTVEISFSVDAIYELMTHSNREFYKLLLKKDVINQKVFSSERQNYVPSTISDNFLVDKAVEGMKSHINAIPKPKIQKINQALRETFLKQLDRECNSCYFIINVDQTYYLVNFFQLENIQKIPVGYIVNYQEEPGIKLITENFLQHMLINELLLFIISLLVFFFIRNQIRQRRLLHKMARTDNLTGLTNRSIFKRALSENIKRSNKKQWPLSLIFFDIDHFKNINDTYGHLVGDKVLKKVARNIEDGLTHKDIFARWGGEEFVVLLPNTDLHNAEKVAERLRHKLETMTDFDIQITSSFGVSDLRPDDTAESLMQRGDEMLYISKEQGRNRVTANPPYQA